MVPDEVHLTIPQKPAQQQAKNTRAVGTGGEQMAADHLVCQGYRILHRNWRCRFGEIDLIVMDGDGTTVFVEVKKARCGSFGTPESWVNSRKQQRIYRLAQAYIYQNRLQRLRSRFDVVTVAYENGAPRLHHIKNAFIKM